MLFIITSPAGAVAEYCDKYVCMSVCLSVCVSVREDISGTTRTIFTNFRACFLYGRGSVLLCQGDEIPRRRDSFFGEKGFFPIDSALYSIDREVGVVLHTAGEV